MDGLSDSDRCRLDALEERLGFARDHSLGYPVNAAFDYRPLYRFLSYPVNNIGDAFAPTHNRLNTHEFERDVLEEFARLTHAEAGSVRGYVTGGGTEGNLYALLLARELHPGSAVYASEDAHYSVGKILHYLRMRHISIRSDAGGRLNLEHLREMLRCTGDEPPIILANIGSTMKGATDDLAGVRQLLADLRIRKSYIHADAALSGMILPFVERPQPWDFAAGIDSISISGHKMIGTPIPCGVVLAWTENVDRIARHSEYVGMRDTNLLGSRNAITPLFLWYALRTIGPDAFRRQVQECLSRADYAIERLTAAGKAPWRHRNSITVVFQRPSSELVRKWQLAVQGDIAHIVAMPHVTREQIDRLVDDVVADRS